MFNRNNNDEKIMAIVEGLVKIYRSADSPLVISQKMVEFIEKNGGEVLGTGQNRIGFTVNNYETVFKVAYREIGMRDNVIERYNWSLISSSATVFNAMSPYCPEITNFALEGDLFPFMLEMEFVDDLSTNTTYATAEETATVALMENSANAAKCIDAWTEFFHILDAHPTQSSLNFGNKNGNVAFRDYGYCIPKIDDFEQITNTINGTPVIYEYNNMFKNLHGTVQQKIAEVSSQMEGYAPYDENGNLVPEHDEEASDFVQSLMRVFVENYL